jgi:hypothetical protein
VSPVKYELAFIIPENDILHSHRRENLKSYIVLTGWILQRRCDVSPVRYELGSYIPADIFHSHRRENLSISILEALHCLSSISSFILTRADWTPFHIHHYSENLIDQRIEAGASGLEASNSDH